MVDVLEGLFSINIKDDDEGFVNLPLVSVRNGQYDRNKLKFGMMQGDSDEIIDILKLEYLQKKDVNLGLRYYKEKYHNIPLDDIPILTALYEEMDIPIPLKTQKAFDKYNANLHKQLAKKEKEHNKKIALDLKKQSQRMHMIHEERELRFE
jgi:hypothetical protein